MFALLSDLLTENGDKTGQYLRTVSTANIQPDPKWLKQL